MVLGAGEMAELAVEAYSERGADQIVVVNRTSERARNWFRAGMVRPQPWKCCSTIYRTATL